MNLIDDAEKILEKSGKAYVIITEDDDGGILMRIKYRYKFGLSSVAAIADTILNDYVPRNGYLVNEDINEVIKRTMMLNETEPDKDVFDSGIEQLREMFKRFKTDRLPDDYFDDLRDGEE